MLKPWREYLAFLALPDERRRLVIYSEGRSSWPHLGPVVESLLTRHTVSLSYVSSESNDPGVSLVHPRLSSFVVGNGLARTLFINDLKADLLLMTMPDLNRFHIRRPRRARCCAYLHHSMVSCHMAYRPGAFDGFDAVLCAGPHHVQELRATERQYGLPAKHLVAHGYGRLDSLISDRVTVPAGDRPATVLVAPSWGPNGLLEQHAARLMQALADSRWEVIVRPHPQTVRLSSTALDTIRDWCARVPRMRMELDVAGSQSLHKAQVMVSDWSGAAFDFALGLERPVVFVDVPRKVNNPDYQRLGIDPIEVFARETLGEVLSLDKLALLPAALDRLHQRGDSWRPRFADFRRQWVYHPGQSAEVAADWLVAVLAGDLSPDAAGVP